MDVVGYPLTYYRLDSILMQVNRDRGMALSPPGNLTGSKPTATKGSGTVGGYPRPPGPAAPRPRGWPRRGRLGRFAMQWAVAHRVRLGGRSALAPRLVIVDVPEEVGGLRCAPPWWLLGTP